MLAYCNGLYLSGLLQPMAVSFQCMTKSTTNLKKKKKQSRWHWSDHQGASSRWLSELTALSLHLDLSLSLWKLLPTDCQRWWWSCFWTGVHAFLRSLASEIEKTFHLTNLAPLLAIEWWETEPHFWLQNHNYFSKCIKYISSLFSGLFSLLIL